MGLHLLLKDAGAAFEDAVALWTPATRERRAWQRWISAEHARN